MAVLTACSAVPGAPGQSASGTDADVQRAYDTFVKANMPNVTLDVLKAAKAEGKLTYYHGQTGSDAAMLDLFGKTFPFITVDGVALSGGNLVQRFMTEYQAGQYLADVVFFTSMPAAEQAQQQGFVMPYKIGPADQIPASHQVPGYAYGVYSSVMATAWNADKIDDREAAAAFQTWQGLFDPRWQGKKFTLNSDYSGGTLQVLYVLQYRLFGTRLWERLAQNVTLYAGSVAMANAIASGEVDIAAGGSSESWAQLYEKGAPVHWAYTQPIAAVPVVQFIAAHAPHPNAAKVLQEFIYTVPAQNTYVAQGAFSDIPGTTDNRKVRSEPWFSPPDPGKLWSYTTADINATFPEASAAFRSIFKV